MTRNYFRRGKTLTATLLSLSILLGTTPPRARAAETSRPAPDVSRANAYVPKQAVRKSVTQLPSVFEENLGQVGAGARFVSRGAGHTLLLGAGGVTLALKRGGGKGGSGRMPGVWAPGENARA